METYERREIARQMELPLESHAAPIKMTRKLQIFWRDYVTHIAFCQRCAPNRLCLAGNFFEKAYREEKDMVKHGERTDPNPERE